MHGFVTKSIIDSLCHKARYEWSSVMSVSNILVCAGSRPRGCETIKLESTNGKTKGAAEATKH